MLRIARTPMLAAARRSTTITAKSAPKSGSLARACAFATQAPNQAAESQPSQQQHEHSHISEHTFRDAHCSHTLFPVQRISRSIRSASSPIKGTLHDIRGSARLQAPAPVLFLRKRRDDNLRMRAVRGSEVICRVSAIPSMRGISTSVTTRSKERRASCSHAA